MIRFLSILIAGSGAVFLLASEAMAADFDGDGVADEFTITRDAAKVAREPGIRLEDPWELGQSKAPQPPKGIGFRVRLSGGPQTYLLHCDSFFSGPMWTEGKPERWVAVITKTDRRYGAWKKQVPELRGDAIQVGTEAGIDILLYWTGKRWGLFWPDEDP